MKDWVTLLTAVIQLITAAILLQKGRGEKRKGTPKRRVRRRR